MSDAEENGWDIFINNRCISERNRSKEVLWNKTKAHKGFCFSNFVGEVFIKGNNIKNLPQNSSKDKIDFNSEVMQNCLEFMYEVLQKNKMLFKKADVAIHYDRKIDDVEILEEYFDLSSAKAIGEKSFDRTIEEIKGYIKKRKYYV